MGSMERSFTDQSTLQEDERMALSFMDAHTCGTRSKTNAPIQDAEAKISLQQQHNTISQFEAYHPSLCNLVGRHSLTR